IKTITVTEDTVNSYMDKISKSADKAGAEYFVIKGFNTVGNGSQSSPANVNLEKSDSFAPSFFS
ncbi:hypothetical protein ETR_18681, partial [Erwinia tracheiphila PSU-1]